MAKQLEFKYLHDEVKDSTDKNRQFFFAYVFLLTYILTIVLSTTDRMLLRSFDGIKLPFIDLTLPLIGFYWVIPLFVIALHFNLLHNINSHHFKLVQWRAAFPGRKVPRSLVHAFLFDFAVLEKEGSLSALVRWASSILCFYLGPITLAAVLWKMAKYQSVLLTVWHMVAFGFNLYLVKTSRQSISKNEEAERENFESASGTATTVKPTIEDSSPKALPSWKRFLLKPMPTFPSLKSGDGLKALLVACVFAEGLLSITMSSLPSDCYLQLFSWIPSDYGATKTIRFNELLLPRINVGRNEPVFEINEAEQKTAAASQHQGDWSKWFIRYGHGLDLSNRSLRAAQLAGQNLPRALFVESHLEGVSFVEANLEGAYFSSSMLQHADFSRANLDEAAFQGASLQEVEALAASMRNTSFHNCLLHGAVFENVLGPGLNIAGGIALGVVFKHAHLQGANFSNTNLSGADFNSAHLEGAMFHQLLVWGALFLKTDMRGARFDAAFLQASSFPGANMEGANFDSAIIQGMISFNPTFPILGETGFTQASLNMTSWPQLLDVATAIPEKNRMEYLGRVNAARHAKPFVVKDLPKIDADGVLKAWVQNACRKSDDSVEDDMFAMQTIGYRRLAAKYTEGQTEEDVLALLKARWNKKIAPDFKRAICTVTECTALRNTLKAEHRFDCDASETFQRFDPTE